MSDEVIVAIIGGITTIIAAAIVPFLEKRLDADSHKQSKIILTGIQPSAKKRRGKRSHISLYWLIPLGVAVLFLIIFLGTRHKARQEVEKVLYDSSEFHMNQGDQYAAMDKFESAASEYYQAIEDDDSDAFAHDKYAYALMKQGKLEEALKENIAACALAPDVAQYHNNKGVTLRQMGERKLQEGDRNAAAKILNNAVNAYKIAIELEPDTADYHYNLSDALIGKGFALKSGNIDTIIDAISECRTALKLNPYKSECYSQLSLFFAAYAVLATTGKEYEKYAKLSEEVAMAAVKIDAENAEAYYILGGVMMLLSQRLILEYMPRCRSYGILKSPDIRRLSDDMQETIRSPLLKAIAAFSQAVKLKPDIDVYHAYLGESYYYAGFYSEALQALEAGIELKTATPYQQSISYANAAEVLIALNRYEEALQYIEQAIELYPDDPRPHYLRYTLLTYFNRHEEAARERQIAYDLGFSEENDE